MKLIFSIILFAGVACAADKQLYSTTAPSTGSAYPAPVPVTGQTNSIAPGDDGTFKAGVANPVPRFTVLANTNCVRDNLTGLIWARNTALFSAAAWGVAITNCLDLDYGGQTDWRLPNVKEMTSLFDGSVWGPCIPSGHPFFGVPTAGRFWTSTTRLRPTFSDRAATFASESYDTTVGAKTDANLTWPVRGPE